jgi:hypothetical protein
MSRSRHNSKGPGFEYWSRRANGTGKHLTVPGRASKKLMNRAARHRTHQQLHVTAAPVEHAVRPACRCSCSTGIHDGLTFGSGQLDDYGFWENPCWECARWHEQQDGKPVNTYWPFTGSMKVEERTN